MRIENPPEKKMHKLIALLISLKDKREGSIKGRGVADRRNKREKIEPKDATSPTVLTE